MQNTTHYNLKKPDYTDFADIQDINDNMDTIDEELAAPTGDARDQVVSFTDADLDSGITSFPTFLTKIVSGMKLAKFLRDFKAGMAYVLHVGDLINNATCTESGKALDARMGKTLQDQITSLNDSLANLVSYSYITVTCSYGSMHVRKRNGLIMLDFVTGLSSTAFPTDDSYHAIATLPEGYRPGNLFYQTLAGRSQVDQTPTFMAFKINSTGVIEVANWSGAAGARPGIAIAIAFV